MHLSFLGLRGIITAIEATSETRNGTPSHCPGQAWQDTQSPLLVPDSLTRRVTRRHFLVTLAPVCTLLVTACSGRSTPPDGAGSRELVAYPERNQWPEPQWSQAKPAVREAYRYALANPEVLKYFPCYCGCGEDGHASNRDCYVREVRRDGSVVLDPMSFG